MGNFDDLIPDNEKKKKKVVNNYGNFSDLVPSKPSQVAAQEIKKQPNWFERIKTGVSNFVSNNSGKKKIEQQLNKTQTNQIQKPLQLPQIDTSKINITAPQNIFDSYIATEKTKSATITSYARDLQENPEKYNKQYFEEIEKVKRTELKEGYIEPTGIAGRMIEDFQRGSLEYFGSSAGGGIEMVGRMTKNILLTEVGRNLSLRARKELAARPELNLPGGGIDPKKNPALYASSLVASSMPSVLGSYGSSIIAMILSGGNPIVGKVVGSVASFTTEGGSQYLEAKEFGASEKEAQLVGSLTGSINAAIEQISLNALFKGSPNTINDAIKKQTQESLVKPVVRFIKKVGYSYVKQGWAELREEFLQQLVSNIMAFSYDKNRKLWDGVVESSLGGFLSGGLFGAFESGKSAEYIHMNAQIARETVEISNLRDTEAGKKILEVADEAEKENKEILIDPRGEFGKDIVETPDGNKIGIELGEKTETDVQPLPPEQGGSTIRPMTEEEAKIFEEKRRSEQREKLEEREKTGTETSPEPLGPTKIEQPVSKEVVKKELLTGTTFVKDGKTFTVGEVNELAADKETQYFASTDADEFAYQFSESEIKKGQKAETDTEKAIKSYESSQEMEKNFKGYTPEQQAIADKIDAARKRLNEIDRNDMKGTYKNERNDVITIINENSDKLDELGVPRPHIAKGILLARKLTDQQVFDKAVDELKGYIKRNKTVAEFISDVNTLGQTFGEFEGSLDVNKDKVTIELSDGRTYSFKTKDIYETGKNRVEANKEPTQKEIVKETIAEEPKSIQQIAEETKILEPNIRRILGVGEKEGTFTRVEKGVYVLNKDGQDIAFVETGDALEALPRLAKDGFKADMVFLDIPYKTAAVTGGNRGVKYNLLAVDDFSKVLDSVGTILRTPDSILYYMYSKAKSGMADMMKYNQQLAEKGFKVIGEGNYTKYQLDGITRVRNMRGNVIEPEGIIMLNQSGSYEGKPTLDFDMIRPKGYQTEKPADMLDALIMQGTEVGGMVLDPFAGSGVTLAEAVKQGRKAYGIEISPEAVENYIKPKLEEATKTESELKKQFMDLMETQLREAGMEGESRVWENAKFTYEVVKTNLLVGDNLNPNNEKVKEWETKIKNGVKPVILTSTQGEEINVVDGSHKLQAYKNLGVEEVPTINADMDEIAAEPNIEELKRMEDELPYDPSRLEKRIYNPNTVANPTPKYSLQVRYKGWAADEQFFDTMEEAQTAMDNYEYKGLNKSVAPEYQAMKEKYPDFPVNFKPIDERPVVITDKVAKAGELGREAFKAGIPRVPARDSNMLDLQKGLQVGEAQPLLEAWIKEWDKANLAEPVVETITASNLAKRMGIDVVDVNAEVTDKVGKTIDVGDRVEWYELGDKKSGIVTKVDDTFSAGEQSISIKNYSENGKMYFVNPRTVIMTSKGENGKIDVDETTIKEISGDIGEALKPEVYAEPISVGTEELINTGSDNQINGEETVQQRPEVSGDGNADIGNGSGTRTTSPEVNKEEPTNTIVADTKKSRIEVNKEVRDIIARVIKDKGEAGSLNPANYSASDKALFRAYSGEGGLGGGNLNEFYTPNRVVKLVYQKLKDIYGMERLTNIKKIVEPSIGTGRFIRYSPYEERLFKGYEIDRTGAVVSKVLHPKSTIVLDEKLGFSSEFIKDRQGGYIPDPSADLVIGNPPYGTYSGIAKGMGEGNEFTSFEEYFVARGLDILNDGGIEAYVVQSSFLRGGQTKGKDYIAARGTLKAAYRLPNKTFAGSGTTVGTDIIILERNKAEGGKVEDFINDNYFKNNPDNVFGKETEKQGRFGMEKYIEGDISSLPAEEEIEKIKTPLTKDNFIVAKPKEFYVRNRNSEGNEVFEKAEGARSVPIVEGVDTFLIEVKESYGDGYEVQVVEGITGRPLTQAKDRNNAIEKAKNGIISSMENFGNKINDEIEKYGVSPRYEVATPETIARLEKEKAAKTVKQTEDNKKILKNKIIKEYKSAKRTYNLTDNSNVPKVVMKGFINSRTDASLEPAFANTLTNEDKLKHFSYSDGKWYLDNNYTDAVNLYDRLNQLEEDSSSISEEQYNKQKNLLIKALPTWTTAEEIGAEVTHKFWEEVQVVDQYNNQKSIVSAFTDKIYSYPREMFEGLSNTDINNYIYGRRITGWDEKLNDFISKNRMRVANKLFRHFLSEIDIFYPGAKKTVENSFNHQYNAFHTNDHSDVPVISPINDTFFDPKEKLVINDAQRKTIGFNLVRGKGINALDVGVGKTLAGVITTNEMFARGWAKRSLLVVPNAAIGQQWIKTFQAALPYSKVYDLTDVKNIQAMAGVKPDDKSVVLMTEDGFKKIGLTEESYTEIEPDVLEALINPDLKERDTKIAIEKIKAQIIGKAMKGTGEEVTLESLGVDMMMVDEAHNYNHIVEGVPASGRAKSEYSNLHQTSSLAGVKAYVAAQYIQKNNNNRNVFLLTATPVSNSPLEYYSMDSLVGKNELREMGITNVKDFIDTFMSMSNKLTVNPAGQVVEAKVIDKFVNYDQFIQLQNKLNIRIDGDEAGVVRPTRIDKNTTVNPSRNQFDLSVALSNRYVEIADQMKATQDKELRKKLFIERTRVMTAMVNNSFSEYATSFYSGAKPTYKQFVENTPKVKLALSAVNDNIKANPQSNNIIFSRLVKNDDLGISYFDLMKEYLIKEYGLKDYQIGIISGAEKNKQKRIDIQDQFNAGKIRVVLGSEAILEGLNLQKQTTDMFVLTPFWNYTAFRQFAGRGWRQGNMWDAIRIWRLMSKDTGDIFITQKLLNKEVLDKQANVARKTGQRIMEMEGDTIEFEEVLDELLTDPVQRLVIKKAMEQGTIVGEIAGYSSKLDQAKRLLDPDLIGDIQEKMDRAKERIEEGRPKVKQLTDRFELVKNSTDSELIEATERELNEETARLERNEAIITKGKLDIKNIEFAIQKDNITQETITYYEKLIEDKKLEQTNLDEKYKKLNQQAKVEKAAKVWQETDYKKILDTHKKDNETFFVKAKVPNDIRKSLDTKIVPSGNASLGGYAQLSPSGIEPTTTTRKLSGLQFPEIVSLAKELTGNQLFIKHLKNKLGVMYEKGKGVIKLTPELFTDTSPEGLRNTSAILAHEIGHVGDYIPEGTTKRGNLVGHIVSLNKFMKAKYGDLVNKDIKAEVKNLSQLWSPFDENNEKMFKYRYSAKELYADMVSVLLVDPGLLQKEAPLFYDGFFEYIDKKEEFRDIYFETIELINRGEDAVFEERLADKYAGYERAAKKRQEIADTKAPKKGIWERFMRGSVSTSYPLYRNLKKVNIGVVESSAQDLRETAEEYKMKNNDIKLFLDKVTTDIEAPLKGVGIDEKSFGYILDMERAAFGDRLGMANPNGLIGNIPEADLSKFYKKMNWSDDQIKVLEQVKTRFHELIYSEMERGVKNGNISREMFEAKIKPNKDTYATISVVHYINKNYIPAGIKSQVGTLSENENPYIASVMKTVSMIDWNITQETKVKTVMLNMADFPDDVIKAKATRTNKGTVLHWDKVDNKEVLTLREDGKLIGYHVDPYIKSFFDSPYTTPNEKHIAIEALEKYNGVFKKLVTTYKLAWALYSNPIKDFKATYIKLGAALDKFSPEHKLTIGELLTEWVKAIPTASKLAKGQLNDSIREMLKDKAISNLYIDYDPYTTNNSDIQVILKKYGFVGNEQQKIESVAKKTLGFGKKILDAMAYAGGVFEATTKIAGYQITKKRIKDGHRLGYIVRNYVGTPNYTEGGSFKEIENQVYVFSNVMVQAIRSNIELATDPKSASGYWMRTFMVTALPKIIMALAAAGLFGELIKKIMQSQTEYKKTNYTLIPLGVDENGKGVTLGIPGDSIDNFIGGIVYKTTYALTTGKLRQPEQLLSSLVEFVPGTTPIIQQIGDWLGYLQGKNPYDTYRGRLAIDDTTWKAGGLIRLGAMLKYSLNENGIANFKTYDDSSKSTFETIVNKLPIVNRMINVSNYGIQEQYDTDEVVRNQNRETIAKRNIVDKYVKQSKGIEDPAELESIRTEMVKEYFGKETSKFTKDEVSEAKRLIKKFTIDREKGSSPYMDKLIYSGTNAEKVDYLMQFKRDLDKEEFDELVRSAASFKIISTDVIKQLKYRISQEGKEQSAIPEEKRIGLNFDVVKDAYAAEGIEDSYKKLTWSKDIRTGWEKFLGNVSKLIPGEQKFENPVEAISEEKLNIGQKREYYNAMLTLRQENPDWYYKNIGNKVEKRILGFDLGDEEYVRAAIKRGEWTANGPRPTEESSVPVEVQKETAKVTPTGFIPKTTDEVEPAPTVTSPKGTDTPYNDTIKEVFGDKWKDVTKILKRTNESGQVVGENVQLLSGPEVDIPNKTIYDPEQGKTVWNNAPDAPVDKKADPFTGKMIDSIDRGLFRINNETFLTYLRGKEERANMYKAGIIDEPHLGWDGLTQDVRDKYWDYMLDAEKNIKMAKLIMDKQGEKAWYASKHYIK